MRPTPGDLGSWFGDLELSVVGDYVPVCDACRPYDLGSMSSVMAPVHLPLDSNVILVLVTSLENCATDQQPAKHWLS